LGTATVKCSASAAFLGLESTNNILTSLDEEENSA